VVRKSAYEGLRTIGPFVCDNGFVEIVKLRNKLARALGYVDYYDYKVTIAEGMSKDKLFEILDGLEHGTRPIMEASLRELENRHGAPALEPWNTSFMLAGSVMEKMVSILLAVSSHLRGKLIGFSNPQRSNSYRIRTFPLPKRPSDMFRAIISLVSDMKAQQ
jgi:hypothetical protein